MNLFRRNKSSEDAAPVLAAESRPNMAKGGATTTTALVRDLLIVTYAVPVERLRPLLPAGLAPDQLPGADGESVGFAQTLCGFYEDARWSPLPDGAGQSFHQASYRILTRREGRRGAFHWRTFVSASENHAAKRILDKQADFARFLLFH